MSKKLYLTFDTSLTDICEINSSFDRGVLRICYAGENRNKSYIAKEDLERCVKTLPYVPIVGNYIRSEEDFGGHDVEVITTLDGEIRLVNKTQPLGVVPADANIYFETFGEHEYLCTDVLLWKRQEAYKKIKEDGVVSHSMEITVKSGETIDGIFHIYDFEFTALCLLGADVTPCFEESALEVFTTSDFKAQFELMMEDLKESFNLATTSSEEKNISQDDTLMKGGEEDLKDETKEVFAEEEIIEPETSEEFEEESEVAPEEAPEETPAEEEIEEAEDEDPEEDPDSEESEETEDESFALNGQLCDAFYEAVRHHEIITDADGYSYPRYWFVDFDVDLKKVYMEDTTDYRLYGCDFKMDGDNVVIDFDSIKRMKYAIVEFDEGEENQEMSIFEKMQKSFEEKYNEKIETYEQELANLRQFKEDADNAAAVEARQSVISEFADLTEIPEFNDLCEHAMDLDVDTLREKCYAIRGKNIANPASAKFSMNSGMPKFPVESNGVVNNEDKDAPYGGIVEKYKR